MLTLDWPTTRAFAPETFAPTFEPDALGYRSPASGSQTVYDKLTGFWRVRLHLPAASVDEQAVREAFFTRARGAINRITLWHLLRPQPAGTLRGAPTLAANAAQGADTLVISTTPGATLAVRDLLGTAAASASGGSSTQVLAVAAAATADGAGQLTVTLANPTRVALPAGTALVWDKPRFTLRLTGPVPVVYTRSRGEPMDVELVEDW